MPDPLAMAPSPTLLEGIITGAPPILPCVADELCYAAGGRMIIDRVSLTLGEGGVSVIMGPNGAGKSVLVRLLHGMLEPASGTVRWAGRPPDETLRKRQAMVFQTPVLLRRSVRANIDFILSLRGRPSHRRCDEMLELVGLLDHADKPARRLSGGESQRLAIARALAAQPDVLFLDEPTVSLDPATVALIESIVAQVAARGMKIIFITHDIAQARRLADEVIFVHRGRVVEQAPAADFFASPKTGAARDYLAGRIVM